MTLLLTLVFFALCMAGMAVGVLLSDRSLRGSCGGGEVEGPDGEALSCGACPKKERDICASDDPLVGLAQIAYPNPKGHHS
ncbi:MAG: hypothetical protein H6732_12805 [Alphaproteobacteria bacterium]|nr:hypothetical protein [Alphaproteobacteria bacterium]